jgi:hypothetical protein
MYRSSDAIGIAFLKRTTFRMYTATLQGSCSDDCSRRNKCEDGRKWSHESRLKKKTSPFSFFCHYSTELEFLKSLWELGTEEEEGYRTGPPGYIG